MQEQLDFCELDFYENYVICRINEGEEIDAKKNNLQTDAIIKHFKGKPFVYITHRVNSYSVDPKIYYDSSEIESLVGFAVVGNTYLAVSNAEIEKLFLKKPFEIFTELDEAVDWAHTILKSK
ncbi:hypothetical protein [Algibacter luteus]|uniref:SpoIIAA-like n=1 Tax=Algibacter luteus TaxID=1178825 RepID=A0A1M6C1T0_9FLAO|nr:hypothetical protein [Algibacter luteus]SHI54893.1 hypothetical protein SAMN05216261_1016 [Algibacter luteus]